MVFIYSIIRVTNSGTPLREMARMTLLACTLLASTLLACTLLASTLLALHLPVSVLIYIAGARYGGVGMRYCLPVRVFAPCLDGSSIRGHMRLREREVAGIEILPALEWI